MSWSTSELRVRLVHRQTGLSPPVKYFYWPFQGGASFVDHLCNSVFFCYAFMHVCLLMPCGHLLGKGWPFGSRLWCLIVKLSLSHWYPGSGVVLHCIDSWSLPSFLLYFCSLARHGLVSARCLMRLSDTMVHLLWPLEMDPFRFYFWDWHKIYCCTVSVEKKRTWPLLTFRKSHSTCYHTVLSNIVDTRHKKVSWRLCFTLYYISRNSLFLSVINTKTTEELRDSSFSQKHS